MIAPSTLDWPLSREEKKHRLLQLYDSDLRAADTLLQSSCLHESDLQESPDLPYFSVRIGQDASESNKIRMLPKAFIPGAVEELNTDDDALPPFPCLEVCGHASSSASCSAAIEKDKLDTTRGVVETGVSVSSSSTPRIRPREKNAPDEAQSSNGGQSARSFEYLTPESVPRTPPGVSSTTLPRTVHAQPPCRAPTERRPSLTSKDVYYCDKTATVIPAIPPMPLAPHFGDRKRNSAAIPTMPSQILQDIRNLPKRPKSAAAAPRKHEGSSDATRRRSLSKERKKWDAFQVLSSARHGKYEEVETALSTGFAVNFKDTHGNTIFHVACQNGRKRIAKLAVKYGANIDAQNAKGNTGLHFLYAYGYPDIADYFIGKGAREDIRNEAGKVAREGIR
mmetsp:Transcript_36758/g.58853  ORF Transcript_36758/g.58853 Transcript_36758/m.58853 type:complete len:394 (+) Transcript_36758:116-1297(+)